MAHVNAAANSYTNSYTNDKFISLYKQKMFSPYKKPPDVGVGEDGDETNLTTPSDGVNGE